MADFGGKANTTIDGSNNLTYGIDAQGKMYIYNLGKNKMIFYGDPSEGFAEAYVQQNEGNRLKFEGDQRKNAAPATTPSNTGGGGGGFAAPAKVLDQAQVDSLNSLLGSYDQIRGSARQKNTIKRDTSLREKEEEKKREEGKYQGKKMTTLQDFSGAKTDTDLGTTRTLENLISSLSTMGLGGSRALQRQILDAANMSNRKANATQATTNKELDTSFNDYVAGNENDVKKIQDQFGYDEGEAERKYNQDKQTTLYKLADTYDNGGNTAKKNELMRQGSDLNSIIAGSAFLNPSYTGETREMATPELADYTQDIAKYDTSAIGMDGMTPVIDGAGGAGNLAVRAIAVNDKDLGIKKKSENDLGYGV
jgi:hypothetical protein